MSANATTSSTSTTKDAAPLSNAPAAEAAKTPEPAPILTPEPEPEKMPGDALDKSKVEAESGKTAEKTIEYKFENVPEGYDTKEVEAFAKEHGLSQKAAQKIIDRDFTIAQRVLDNQKAAFEAEQKKWVSEVMSDPQLGGDNLEKTRSTVNNAWLKIPQDVRKWIQDSGHLNNPKLIKMLNAFGSLMAEDRIPGEKVSSAPASKKPLGLQALFEEIHNKS